MVDWKEIERLQADFQKTQKAQTMQKFSERNCVEIISKLQEMNLLTVLHTIDGKEYITPQHLKKEIKDELYVHNGRVSLVELQQILNVDFSHIEVKCKELIANDKTVQIVYGQLIDDGYLDRFADDINDNLQSAGFVKIAELSKESDLPGEFLIPQLIARLGTRIKGEIDKHNKDVIFTEAYLARQKALIRGMLTAATKPTSLQTLTTNYGLSVQLVHSLLDSLIQEGRLRGQVSGGRSEKAVFHPAIYAQTQDKWVDNFYRQNQYIEYHAVEKLGISDAKSYLKRKFSGDQSLFLSSVCLDVSWKDRVSATLDETVSESDWIDVMTILPTSLGLMDGNQLIQDILRERSKDKNAEKLEIFADTIVARTSFAESCTKFFQGLINEKARAVSKKSSILALTEQERKEYLNIVSESTARRGGKKEDRRKKTVEVSSKKTSDTGGGNSGVGGREVKTRGKDKKRMKWAKENEAEEKDVKSSKAESNQFMQQDEITDVLQKSLPDCPEDLCYEIAQRISKQLQQMYDNALKSVFLAISKEISADGGSKDTEPSRQKQSLKARMRKAEEELTLMWNKARLFYDGLQLFEGDVQSSLEKYLLKTVGTDVVNKIFILNTDDTMSDIDTTMELTSEMRIKIVSLAPDNIKPHLTKLNNVISGKSFEAFKESVDETTEACGVMLRQNDKKKDRLVIHGNRKSLLEQMELSGDDSAMLLHLASTIVFQSVTGCMLHSPGRHVPDIVDKLEPLVEHDVYSVLMKVQDLIRQKIMIESDDSDPDNETAARLEQIQSELAGISGKVKELAVVTKKKK